jgi:hypothetical protein
MIGAENIVANYRIHGHIRPVDRKPDHLALRRSIFCAQPKFSLENAISTIGHAPVSWI